MGALITQRFFCFSDKDTGKDSPKTPKAENLKIAK